MRAGVFISNVQTAASSYNLVDLPTLKTLLGVATGKSDAAFALWIAQASAAARKYCNNPFVVETIEDQAWPRRDGIPWTVRADLNALQLARWPVVSITSVTETITGTPTALVAGADYLSDNALGRLYRLDADGTPKDWWADPVTVVYSAGYAVIPADVVDAVADIVKMRWYGQTRDPAIRSQNSPGVYEAAYVMGTGPGGADDMSAYATAKLDRYRVPVVG